MDGGSQVDWIVIAPLLPHGLYPEPFAERGDLAAGRDAAAFQDAHPHIVDQAFRDQRDVLLRLYEELAHRLWGSALFADHSEPRDLLGRQNVLQKEKTVGLEQFGQSAGVLWPQMLVHIVGQLGTEPSRLRSNPNRLGMISR